jgi:hypothetical protein
VYEYGLGRWLRCVFSRRCADVDVFYYVGKGKSPCLSVMGSVWFFRFAFFLLAAYCVRREVIIRIEEHMADGCLV